MAIGVFYAALAAVAGNPMPEGEGPPAGEHLIEFSTDESTWMDVDVSPSGSSILFTVLGDIYIVPIAGGTATLLRGGRMWDHMPRFSPDGQFIAFVSRYDGSHKFGSNGLWIMDADGANARRMSTDSVVSPVWSADGTHIFASVNSFRIRSYSVADGSATDVGITPADPFENRVSDFHISGSQDVVYYSAGMSLSGHAQRVRRMSLANQSIVDVTAGDAPSFSPRLSPNGKLLAYATRRGDSTRLLVRNLETGTDREVHSDVTRDSSDSFFNGSQTALPMYAFTPDSKNILIAIGGRIVRIDVESAVAVNVPFLAKVRHTLNAKPVHSINIDETETQVRHLRWTSFSFDGNKAVFSASGKIWLSDLADQKVLDTRRVTNSKNQLEYAPAISPDGKRIAYVEWTDAELGRLVTVLIDGTSKQVHDEGSFISNPSWSQDSKKIAYLKRGLTDSKGAFGPDELKLYWVAADGGNASFLANVAVPSYDTSARFSPPLTFDEDGSRIYFDERRSTMSGGGIELFSVNLDGTNRRSHLVVDDPVDHVIPSPNGNKVAILGRTAIWILDRNLGQPQLNQISSPSIDATGAGLRRISTSPAAYLSWQDNETLRWSNANRLFEWNDQEALLKRLGDIEIAFAKEEIQRPIAFINARQITMSGSEIIESGSLLVSQSRINAVGLANNTKVPPDSLVIDSSGRTIIPGLIDTHYHIHHAGREVFRQLKPEYLASLAYGVTTGLDVSAPTLDVLAQAEMIRAGVLVGPRIYSTGLPILGNPNPRNLAAFVPIETPADAYQIVKSQSELGATAIKSYTQPDSDQRRWLVDAARENNIPIVTHGNIDLISYIATVVEGHNAYEHFYIDKEFRKDVHLFVARSGTHTTPTLGTIIGHSYSLQQESVFPDVKLRRFTSAARLARFIYLKEFSGRDASIGVSDGLRARLKNLLRIVRAGGKVDVGSHGDLPGFGTHWEMWLFAIGGFSQKEMLRAATLTGAEKLGLQNEIGSLEEGKLADFLVLRCNPLENIRCTADIEYVVKNGFVWHADSMTQMWPEYKPLPKPWWHSDDDWEELKPELPEPWEGVPIADGVELEQTTIH